MQTPTLFSLLPDYVSTPDGMAIDPEGNLVLSCPNFADTSMPGCLLKIGKNKYITKWVDVPAHQETGCARPMGIAFGPDGAIYICDNQGWSGDEKLMFKGRLLRLLIEGSTIIESDVVAYGMEHPNGIRFFGDYMYVTQSLMTKAPGPEGKLLSCVYRFHYKDRDIKVDNLPGDPNILETFVTLNPECQYGADGIEVDAQGNIYVGNFGDGAVHKVVMKTDGTVKESFVWAKDSEQLRTTDGMTTDAWGNMYVADFSANAVARIDPNGKVRRIAQSPDSDGFNGELDQPGEPCFWNGVLVVSCFDLVTGPDKVNTGHEMPATLSQLLPEQF